ncbi:MAG: rhodanese-related sulfurtransferase [Candidatus Gracilibacteria bacterium]
MKKLQPKEIKVLLYYNYVKVENPELTTYEHLSVCKALGLLGRIYIAHEGINGTCAGPADQVDKYIKYMRKHPLFADTEFKVDYADESPFRKIFVRVRPELAALDRPDLDPRKDGGKHLSPKEFHEMLLNDPDAIAFDGRNNYEAAIGKFENAVTPDVANFRDLPKALDQYEEIKEKKILMYCTGGIRCEKASALLKEQGFKNVYQLKGGIIRYSQEIPEEESLYKGKCFVFDDRIAVPVTKDVLTECTHCDTACDRYLNCTNAECNKLFVCCDACKETHHHACSEECAKTPRKEWKRQDMAMNA